MSTTTLVRTFLRNVSIALADIAPQFVRYPEQELVVYTNFGQRALAKYVPHIGSRVDAVRLEPGTKQNLNVVPAARILPGLGGTPVDVYGIALLGVARNMGANGSTPGRVPRIVDRTVKDASDPDWHAKTSTVVREVMTDQQTPLVFYVSPGVPSTPNVWVELSWMAEPARVPAGGEQGAENYAFGGASTTLLGIPDVNVEDLHNYVVAMALMKGSKNVVNIPKAQAHESKFVSSLNAQVKAITGVSPNLEALPFAGEVAAAAGGA